MMSVGVFSADGQEGLTCRTRTRNNEEPTTSTTCSIRLSGIAILRLVYSQARSLDRQDPCRARPRTRRLPEGLSVDFTTAASLVHELIEARDERRLLNLQKKLARLKLLIVDELGFVPLSKTGAELLFEVFSQRYERGSVLVTTNLPFDEWTEVFGSERLTGALLDRLTHRVHILEMNGESYRLKQSRLAVTTRSAADSPDA